jgi:adenylate cyclase
MDGCEMNQRDERAGGFGAQAGHAAATTVSPQDLLLTYIGGRTGERVLAGEIKPGQGETIHAVILFCDLRDSTRLSEAMPLDDFLRLLNGFFNCTASAVLDHGGEILSYIGDAVFAVFPIGGTAEPLDDACTAEEGACAAALAAARDAQRRLAAFNEARRQQGEPPLAFSLALHAGDVKYGNIGVAQRLQFTIIGTAVNEAARLVELCKTLGRSIVVSSAFPRCFPHELVSLGLHKLRGVRDPQEVFGLSTGSVAHH